MTRAAVALGSNLGDRLATLRSAVLQLSGVGTVLGVSSLYETAPVGGPEQGAFLNAIAVIDTELDAASTLARLHEIEAAHDREREVHWGPRTLDLDLILFGDEVHVGEALTVPHPRYTERRFVLEPLLEVWPAAVDPSRVDLSDALAGVQDQELSVSDDPSWISADSSRGGGWVIGQMVSLAAFLVVVAATSGQLMSELVRLVGGAIAVVGAILFVMSLGDLGRLTTPYPEPMGGGAVVHTGVYGRARHPMYGAVLLVTLGLAGVVESGGGLAAWIALVVFFTAKSADEERRLIAAYPGYAAYKENVWRRFVPFVA